ncbi:hypothetical protein D3C77_743270 [compost metagenome]
MAGGGKSLVPGDLRAGDAGPVHALQGDGIAAVVHDANGFQHANGFGLGDGRTHHHARFFQFQAVDLFHVRSLFRDWSRALSPRGRWF